MKINVGFYIKKLFWQLSWGEGYKEKKLKKSKQKHRKLLFSQRAFFMLSTMWFPLLN